MPPKFIRRLIFSLGLMAILVTGFWYLGVWSVRRTFEETYFDGLTNLLEASAGRALSNADAHYEVSGAPPEGMISFYAQHPEALRNDKELFRTWSAALSAADYALQHHSPPEWQSSLSLDWIAPENAYDAWNHPFCLKTAHGVSVVVSAGPQALAPLACGKIALPLGQLSSLKQGRLNRHPSGALILVLKRRAT